MIKITFPDGAIKEYNSGITGIEIAEAISKSLAKDSLAVEINGEEKDLSVPITEDSTLKIITSKTDQGLEIIRHDAAHIFAHSLKELYPDAQITIGPAIENGFYYDFSCKTQISSNDLEKIEEKMREIMKRGDAIIREEWDRDEAVEFFKSMGEHYKAEIIESIPAGEKISLYRQGDFIDLCRGPHALTTSFPKHIKLTKIAGAYWRGDSKNEMLQRVYGTAWATKEQLENYLFMIEEAEKRDHRKLGKELDLFHFQDEARGMPFWHDKGWTIYRLIEQYIRNKIRKDGYSEVKTPVLVDRALWEASGHWEKFRQNMFTSEIEDEVLALKPMNCPCHVQIFKQGIKSYKDLPLRMAEFGMCHRYEPSGALHGLMRVRGFVQDDAHIFCMESQITEETIKFCNLLKEVYKDFGFTDIKVKFSDRPEIRAGSDETWDKSEKALRDAIEATGLPYTTNPGEGAFYGPKLEFVLRDAIGRDWQCGTLQVDPVIPERLGAEYVTAAGTKDMPIMLHRAIIGSFERFIGILIEQYAGKFPIWLAPVQVAVLTITNDADSYANEIHKRFIDEGLRSELDISAEKINYKVRNFSMLKTPLLAVVGKKEQENGTVAVRFFGSEDQKIMAVEEFIEMVDAENKKYF
jgi:threonyl-tRNA synthetase